MRVSPCSHINFAFLMPLPPRCFEGLSCLHLLIYLSPNIDRLLHWLCEQDADHLAPVILQRAQKRVRNVTCFLFYVIIFTLQRH